jgi:hypothetical protein
MDEQQGRLAGRRRGRVVVDLELTRRHGGGQVKEGRKSAFE